MSNKPVRLPAGYAPAFAMGVADGEGNLALVGNQMPLPVVAHRPALPGPIEGATGSSTVAGPFYPALGVPVMLVLSGEWEGRVAIQRSTDGGNTRVPVTAGGITWGRFAGNVCEPVWEESESGAALYLDITINSGSLTYRFAQ